MAKTEQIDTMYGTFISWKDDLISTQLKTYSAHTRNELAMIKSLVKEGDNIIDIGAHIGTFSIPFSQFANSKGKVFSFEGSPNNFELLQKNINNNQLQTIITPIQAIVSVNEDEQFDMRVPDDDNTGAFYFAPGSEGGDGSQSVININNWFKQPGTPDSIQFIKIDVEGAEVSVLQSCIALIEQFKPVLYIEISEDALQRFDASIKDIDEMLSANGYHYFHNIGPRNSKNDHFVMAKLSSIAEGGDFYDLLAIHPTDRRYPKSYLSGRAVDVYLFKAKLMKNIKYYYHRILSMFK